MTVRIRPKPRHYFLDEEPDFEITLYPFFYEELGGGCRYCGYTSHLPSECPLIQRVSQ